AGSARPRMCPADRADLRRSVVLPADPSRRSRLSHRPRWAAVQPALLGFGLGIVGQLVIWFLGEPADYLAQWFTSVLSDFVLLLIPWWLGRTLQLRETRRRQEAAVIADLARARERTRIAEDMHDLIGHDLALIAVHSGALEVLPGASEKQRQAAADIRLRAV